MTYNKGHFGLRFVYTKIIYRHECTRIMWKVKGQNLSGFEFCTNGCRIVLRFYEFPFPLWHSKKVENSGVADILEFNEGVSKVIHVGMVIVVSRRETTCRFFKKN